MSTNDVPGANAINNDELKMGCWAEHDDGSLIFVESTEANKVIYSIFDPNETPVIEYRDSMEIDGFKTHFSWDAKNQNSIKWTWHDKTPFPWDRVINAGAKDGPKFAHVDDQLSAAQKVAESRNLIRGTPDTNTLRAKKHKFRTAMEGMKNIIVEGRKGGQAIVDKVQRAINELRV